MRDINALVEDMISSNSQCRVAARPFLLSPPPSRGREPEKSNLVVDPSSVFDEVDGSRTGPEDVDDEGFCEDNFGEEEEMEMSLRRASAPSGIRKYNVRYGRSADVVNIGGKVKVKSLPRMRKRKVQVSRPQE